MMRLLLVACLAAGLLDCTRLRTGALEQFAVKHSCPEERVTVRERDDLRWSTIARPPAQRAKPTPPPDVSADPGRLAKWTKDNAARETSFDETLDGFDVFEVSGCDQRELMGCRHCPTEDNNGIYPLCVECIATPMPQT